MIYRAEHKTNFFVVSNDIIRSDLSDGAKVLLLFMLSCSDEWVFSQTTLAHQFNCSKRKIERLVKELRESGYVVLRKINGERGHFGSYEWDVYENPTDMHILPSSVKNRVRQNTEFGKKPSSVKSVDIINTNNTKEIPNKDKEIPSIFRKPNFEEVKAYCDERGNKVDPQRFIDYYESKGWKVGKSSMKDWKAAVRTWEKNDFQKSAPTQITRPHFGTSASDWERLRKWAEEEDKRRGNTAE